MSGWAIRLPVTDPDQTVADAVVNNADCGLTGEDRRVALQFLLDAHGSGIPDDLQLKLAGCLLVKGVGPPHGEEDLVQVALGAQRLAAISP